MRAPARRHAPRGAGDDRPELEDAAWCSDDWLDDVARATRHSRSTSAATAGATSTRRAATRRAQNAIIERAAPDAAANGTKASRLRAEAEAQLDLLRGSPARRSPDRLLQLPLLRQRGVPARATTSRGCRSPPSSPAARPLAATSSSRGRGSSRSPSSGRARSSTTRAPATSINKVILPVERDGRRTARH